MTTTISRVPVDSSSLASVGYSPENSVLEAEFRHGVAYRFFLVPQRVFDDLLRAESKGTYFNRFIRGRYTHARL